MIKLIVVCLIVLLLSACTAFGALLQHNGIQGTHEHPSLLEVGLNIDKKLIGKIIESPVESKGGCDTLKKESKSECIKQAAILSELINNRKNSSH